MEVICMQMSYLILEGLEVLVKKIYIIYFHHGFLKEKQTVERNIALKSVQ